MPIIANEVFHSYDESNTLNSFSLKNISFEINDGDFVAVLGANGSGKSTLVRHINALIELQKGNIKVNNYDVDNADTLWNLRKDCGMIFQNPENQFVSPIVKEDIYFGLNNFEINEEEISLRTEKVLNDINMKNYQDSLITNLSGGQKQKIAIASVLALDSNIIIFDEATSMLDNQSKEEILSLMKKLNEQGKTIIVITHNVDEILNANKIILMKDGMIVAMGDGKTILQNKELLESASIAPTISTQIYYKLIEENIYLPFCPITPKELSDAICQWRENVN